MKQLTRLLIVDDHPFLSEGLIKALASYPQYPVVGTLISTDGLLAAIQDNRPDVLILDINLSGTNSLETVPELKKMFPKLQVLILSMYMPTDIRLSSQQPMIDSYVLKNSGTDILLEALDRLSKGQRYFDPHILPANHHSEDEFSRKLKLSTREKEILQLIKEGFSSKEISQQLFLSELTVKTHRKNIMAKLDVRNVVELLKKI
jgi:DNA-binding NarL/FixJ family response regulator